MKNINSLLSVLIAILILSCSPSDDTIIDDTVVNNNTKKRLTKTTYLSLTSQYEFNRYIAYDANHNITEISDNEGLILEKYTYNSSNKVVENVLNIYENKTLDYKDITLITYNSNSQISNIVETFIDYNSDGSILSQSDINHNFTYTNNAITRLSDDSNKTKIDYKLSNDLITGIKVFRNNVLKSDMTFAYDNEGNCISGSGPIYGDVIDIDPPTDDIKFSVVYGTEIKNSLFNNFFDYEILTKISFENIRQTLVNGQGNKFAKEIQWYKYNDNTYKETYNYLFDSDGYIVSRTSSEFPDYPNNSKVTFTWE